MRVHRNQRTSAGRRMFKVRWPLLWLHWLLWHEPGPACKGTGSYAGTLVCRCYHSWSCSLQKRKALPRGTRPLVAWLHYFSPNNIVLKSHLPDWRVTDTEKANTRTPADPHQGRHQQPPISKDKSTLWPMPQSKRQQEHSISTTGKLKEGKEVEDNSVLLSDPKVDFLPVLSKLLALAQKAFCEQACCQHFFL